MMDTVQEFPAYIITRVCAVVVYIQLLGVLDSLTMSTDTLGLYTNLDNQYKKLQGFSFDPDSSNRTAKKDLYSDLWALGKTPIKTSVLEKMLKNYPHSEVSSELMEGFINGFRLKYKGPRLPINSKNLQSAIMNESETLEKLNKEVKLGRMIGPFSEKPIATLRTSPIGLVPKHDNKWRLITHLSYPPNDSVNSFIDQEECTVQYTSFDEVLQMISLLGRGALLGIHDIKSAFRLMPVNRADFDLLGIKFNNKYYIDKCLPMGCAISCNLFEKFSTFLHWIVSSRSGKRSLAHYLDDFLFAGARGTNVCKTLMDTFSDTCSELGVPIAKEKSVGPVTTLKFLGLEIDTIDMVVRIPQDKLDKLRLLLRPLLWRKRIQLRDFESVVGLMAFCSRAIPSSRAFLRRFYDVIGSVKNKKPYYSIRINSEIREDVQIWLEFLQKFNGECYFSPDVWVTNDTLQLYTDSAGNSKLGCGAYFNGKWVQLAWPKFWAADHIMKDITFLELVPILLAICIWAPLFKNKKILFHVDNIALVSIINKRTSRSKRVMSLIRPLVLYTMEHNIQFKAKHIEGLHNEIADSLSRFQLQRFRELVPEAELFPEAVPAKFMDMISDLKLTD